MFKIHEYGTSDIAREIQMKFASELKSESQFYHAKQKPKVTNFYPNNIKKDDKMKY